MDDPFVVDTVLEASQICNLQGDADHLLSLLSRGAHVVFFGRRNMGKTSLVTGRVIPEMRRKNKGLLCVFVDFLGVSSEDEIWLRFRKALQHALVQTFPSQTKLKTIAEGLLRLRPIIQVDTQSGELQINLEAKKSQDTLEDLFLEIAGIHRKHKVLLVFDEFQDIAHLKGMDARFRSCLQKLPANFPILIMGSKKHILADLFSLPTAPLAGWGIDVEISRIAPEEFAPYLDKRFQLFGKKIALDEVKYLCEAMQFVPESVLYVCKTLSQDASISHQIQEKDIDRALKKTAEMRRGRFEESLQVFSANERRFLKYLATHEPLQSPTSKRFLAEVQLSSGGVLKILKRLENLGLLYNQKEGWILSDPLMGRYLREFWT